MHHILKRLLPHRLWDNAAGLPILASFFALLLALLTLQIDEVLAANGAVSGGPFSTVANARTLLATLVGAIVTVAGFTFWMRAVMVQLVSSEFSPRILAVYLEDAFQRTITGFMVGALAYVIIVLGAMPTEGEGAVPVLSVLLSIVLTLGSVVSILIAIKNGVRSLEVSQLVRRLTDGLIQRIGEVDVVEPPAVDVDVAGSGQQVLAGERGWLQEVDGDRLLRAMEPGTVLSLDIRVGEFVDVGRPIAKIVVGDADHDGIRDSLTLGRVRTNVQDLSFGFQQLVDVAEQALTTGSNDSTTAYEVIVHLGAALRELMRCGAPTGHVAGEDRSVIATRALSEAALVREVIGRLRLEAAAYPTVAEHLLGVIAAVRDEARAQDRHAAVEELHRQAQRLLDGAQRAGVLAGDFEDLCEVARTLEVGEDVIGEPAPTEEAEATVT